MPTTKSTNPSEKAPTKSELDAFLRKREQEQQQKQPNWKTDFEDGVVALTRVLSYAARENNTGMEQVADALIAKIGGKQLDKSQEDIIRYLNSNRTSRKAFLAKMERERKSGSQSVYISWMDTARKSPLLRNKIKKAGGGWDATMIRILEAMEREVYTYP